MSGLFITLEGGEGAGKTTQSDALARHLESAGRTAVQVHDPGGTALSDYIRQWVKASKPRMSLEAELLLFTAARAQLVRDVIQPWLEKGAVVISDRYADSTTAYQGYGRGLPLEQVRTANAIATGGLWPSLTFLLDLPPKEGLRREQPQASFDDERLNPAGRATESDKRRFEELGLSFHTKVRNGYHKLAKAEPERWVVLNAQQPVVALATQIWERVQPLLAGA